MIIKYFAPRWGFEHIPWTDFLTSVKNAGYAGIEWFPFGEPSTEADHNIVPELLKNHGLEYGIVMAVLKNYPDSNEYLQEPERQLRYFCKLHPKFISAQTGREFYSADQVERILNLCASVSLETGVPIYQETHRNKWAFAAHAVKSLLDSYSGLQLTFDISHWFCVSESYLEDQADTVDRAAKAARHLHARVGHTEGPQVYDPALPEYAEALDQHLRVWDKYISYRRQAGASECTITPEFGPPPYMVFAGKPGEAHEEQWRINLWMKDLLQKRFELLT